VLRLFSENTEKRIEDFKEGFSKGYETTNHVQPFAEETPTRIESYSDEDLYNLEHNIVEEEEPTRVEYMDREDDNWRG
jgi:hypothetical protein